MPVEIEQSLPVTEGREYECLWEYNLALFLEDDVLKSYPIGGEGIIEHEPYLREVDLNALKGEDAEPGLYDAAKAANDKLRG